MKKLFRLVASASPQANILLTLATVLLFAKTLLLNRYPAPDQSIYELGILFEAILASVIASYVFYLLVVHLKEHSDKQTVAPYVVKHTSRVVAECISQLYEIGKKSDVDIDLDTLDEPTVTLALSKIAPYSPAPLVFLQTKESANWLQYFEFHNNNSSKSINRVLAQLPYLEAKHVSLLSAIDDCSHFLVVQQFQNHNISNSDLSAFATSFFEYCSLCRDLKNYAGDHMNHAKPG